MGDRTTVTLTVPTEHAGMVEELLKDERLDDGVHDEKSGLTCYTLYEVNYGEINGLDLLQDAGIAYNSAWEAGDCYGPGCASLRFLEDGTAVIKEIYDSCHSIQINDLMLHIDDFELLRQMIRKQYDYLQVFPWTNQVEYGKRYLARKLIQPTGA